MAIGTGAQVNIGHIKKSCGGYISPFVVSVIYSF